MKETQKEFGEYLKSLRESKPINIDGSWKSLSRAEFAKRVGGGVTSDTIANIEQGKVSARRYLDTIAKALNLDDIQTRTLYTKAGHVYTIPPVLPTKEKIEHVLENIPYPASIRTALWDFLGFNEYHRVLWSYSDEHIRIMKDESVLGANLLRVQFDDRFEVVQNTNEIHNTKWRERAILQFRRLSFPYVNTKRYKSIVEEMSDKYPTFGAIWLPAEAYLRNELPSLFEIPKGASLQHPTFGSLEFLSLRVPQRDIGEGIKIVVYVPRSNTDLSFQKLLESVAENKVYTFEPKQIE